MRRDMHWYDKSFNSPAGWRYGQTEYWRTSRDQDVLFPPLYLKDEAYLPYSEELWTGLVQMQTAISKLEERIHEIIMTPEGNDMIALVGKGMFNLLAPGDDSE